MFKSKIKFFLSYIYHYPSVVYGSKMFNTKIHKTSKIYPRCTIKNTNIGRYSYVGNSTKISNTTIGSFCSIGQDNLIGPGEHPTHYVSTSPLFYSIGNQLNDRFTNKQKFNEHKKVQIGSDVWIGSKVIILGGVNIGNGSIVAGGSVVTKDVPAYSIVGGVPAKVIKYRFNDEIIKSLERTKWWSWSVKDLKNKADLFVDLEEFMHDFKKNS